MLALYISALPDPNDENKFNSFYIEYKQYLLKIAHDQIHDFQLAEDCTHDVLLYIAEHFDKIGNIHSKETKGYIRTIAHAYANRYYNETTKESFLEDITETLPDEVDYMQLAYTNIDADALRKYAAQLKDPFGTVFFMRAAHDMSFAEIAEITGLSEAYTRKVYERAKAKIYKLLKENKSEVSGETFDF